MSFFLSYVIPRYTSFYGVCAMDTSGAYPAGEVYSDTTSDGAIFLQMYSGSSTIGGGTPATLAPFTVWYDLPVGFASTFVMDSQFITINDSSFGLKYQIGMWYDPGILNVSWKIQIGSKTYGSTNPKDFTYKFTAGFSNVTINV